MFFIKYFIFRMVTFPLSFLPYSALHALGRLLGLLIYYGYPEDRKRALTNLALVYDEPLEELAKQSLQNLAITLLEYPKLARETKISRIATCENPDRASACLSSGKGVIFFCGHQANWELLFLEGTSRMTRMTRMKGVAIGRPIKNPYLYSWIVSIRERFGGKIIPPQNALKEGLRALKSGAFLGIVGDQGMPNSGFSCPFLGRLAWTTSLPALLSLRTGAPIIVPSIRRENGRYLIHYSDPIFPEGETVETLMGKALAIFEETVRQNPGQWLWTHNRWKQQLPGKLPAHLRHESIALIFDSPDQFDVIPKLREYYPTEFITAFAPENIPSPDVQVKTYKSLDEIFSSSDRFKLVFNFTPHKTVRSHFLKRGAFHVMQLSPEQLLKRLHAR